MTLTDHPHTPSHITTTTTSATPSTLSTAPQKTVVAVLLPLLGLGRRLPYAVLLQLTVLSEAACYALVVCQQPVIASYSGGTLLGWQLLPEAYLVIG